MFLTRSSPNDGPRRAKQHLKERNVVKHQYASSIVQDRNNHSGIMSQQNGGGPSVYNTGIPLSPHYAQSSQSYMPPVYSMNSGAYLDQARQNDCGGPFPVPIPNRVPPPLPQYPPIHQSQVVGRPAILPHPLGVPFHTMPNSHSSSSGLASPPITQLHPPVTMPADSGIHHNYSYT